MHWSLLVIDSLTLEVSRVRTIHLFPSVKYSISIPYQLTEKLSFLPKSFRLWAQSSLVADVAGLGTLQTFKSLFVISTSLWCRASGLWKGIKVSIPLETYRGPALINIMTTISPLCCLNGDVILQVQLPNRMQMYFRSPLLHVCYPSVKFCNNAPNTRGWTGGQTIVEYLCCKSGWKLLQLVEAVGLIERVQ